MTSKLFLQVKIKAKNGTFGDAKYWGTKTIFRAVDRK